MADRVVLIMARRDGRWIGGALNLLGSDTLFGRNWGATEEVPFLHFEACYYRAIEYAIEHGLQRVEAGAQGEHKIQRGYLPVKTRSAHYVADPRFRSALDSWLEHERDAMEEERAGLATLSPFRAD
jgi:predicted N-acyltransferase